MRILEVCLYSAGICGVWTRVFEEAKRFEKKGHKVAVFSSNKTKGSDEEAVQKEIKEGVLIRRFPSVYMGGESFMYWNYEEEAIKFKPDVIIVHSYRHLHTTKAVSIAKKTGAKVFLVTHAPFTSGNESRALFSKLAVKGYDALIGPRALKKFDKVVAITKWEVPFLLQLGLSREDIAYIPNGIPENFFTQSISEGDGQKILFLGRISPVKDIETLLKACRKLKQKKVRFKVEIVGPAERDYLAQLTYMVKRLNIEQEVKFLPPIYNINEKIKKIDSAVIYALPSKREGMPQSLIEAMARERIVVASDNAGARDLVDSGQNGYLFPIGNADALARCFEIAITKLRQHEKIRIKARKSVEQFKWSEVMKKWGRLFRERK
jgi:glycosyltransferase involved in cell wall biosynthesis